jgi:hypothetical protein
LARKKAIGEHLREGVRELLHRELVEHLLAENVVKAVQPPLRPRLLLPDQLLDEVVAQELRAGCQRQRELLRPLQPLWRRGEEG